MKVYTQDAGALVELVRKRSPDAVRLAQVVSLATRVEPELLRQARLKLLPDVDAGAEADLWFSPLVQSSTPLALVLLPDVADLLRRQLAQSRESLQKAWKLLEEAHRNAPAAIKVEEKITWQVLSGGVLAQEAVEKDLLSVVSAIITQNRTGLARWALRALPRFPAEARRTKAATTLVLTAAAHLNAWEMLEDQIESDTLPAGFLNELRVVLPPGLPPVPVGVRLLKATGELALVTERVSAERYVVEFSNPPSTDDPANAITLPGTNPLLLEVSWDEQSKHQVKHLSLYQGRTENVEVSASEIKIRTASGDIYTLRENRRHDVPLATKTRGAALAYLPRSPQVGYVTRHDGEGRDLVEQLTIELQSKRRRAVALWGMGGVGKTVVAAETARRLIETLNQRVVWLSAEGRSDFNQSVMLDEIAVQLDRADLRTIALRTKPAEVTLLLNSAPTLVVIDQFETIASNEQARCLSFLKRAKCQTLIITRQKIAHAYILALPAMSLAEAQEFLERVINQAHDPQAFREVDRNLLIKVSEGNPLVIRWVVAQIDLTQNPKDVIGDVTNGKGDAVARVFERSFNLPQLGDDGRLVLLALSLFVPDASRQALAVVADFGDDLERMNDAAQRLATLQLMNVAVGGGRLRVEGLVRHLSKARLSKDRRAGEIRRRFVAYFLAYAESRSESTSENYDALEIEFENLLDAMDMASESKDWESVIQICAAIAEFLDVRGYWDEALRRNEQASKAARIAKRTEMLPHLAETAANIFLRRREFNKAEKAYEFILHSYRNAKNEAGKVTNQAGVAGALRHLGSIALERREPAMAEKLYSDSLQIVRKLGDQVGIAANLHNLAIVAQVQGELGKAQKLYQESLGISQEIGNQRSIAISLHQLGVINQEGANYDEARSLFNQSLDIKKKLLDRNGIADTLHQLGLLSREMGDRQQSGQQLHEALEIFEQLGSPIAGEVRQDLETLEDTLSSSASQKKAAKKPTSRKKSTSTQSRKSTQSGASKRIGSKGGSRRVSMKRSKGGYGRASSRSSK